MQPGKAGKYSSYRGNRFRNQHDSDVEMQFFLCWKNKYKLPCLKIYFRCSSLRFENLKMNPRPKKAEVLRMVVVGDFPHKECGILAF